MSTKVTLVTEPEIYLLGEMKLDEAGVLGFAGWVKRHRPDCVPEAGFTNVWDLLPHGPHDLDHEQEAHAPWHRDEPLRALTDNEVLCEIAGRKCYDSFAEKAGKKTNKEYFEHIVSMDPLHASILYHAKMTFGFGGVSRKFSHQFIRNYVGSDREEEGSPSQESTRFTHHYGHYVIPPYILNGAVDDVDAFRKDCQANYDQYTSFIEKAVEAFKGRNGLTPPRGADRKEIYEAAAGYLNMSAETSFVWTTNPMAVRKFIRERFHSAADAEMQRFTALLAQICFTRWPNLFIGKDLDGVRERVRASIDAPLPNLR